MTAVRRLSTTRSWYCGGFRLREAWNITWADCDFIREEIIVRGDAEDWTKNSELSRVRMMSEKKQLLARLRKERRQ